MQLPAQQTGWPTLVDSKHHVSDTNVQGAPEPGNEPDRYNALCRLEVLDTNEDPRFNDITQLVRVTLGLQLSSSTCLPAGQEICKLHSVTWTCLTPASKRILASHVHEAVLNPAAAVSQSYHSCTRSASGSRACDTLQFPQASASQGVNRLLSTCACTCA